MKNSISKVRTLILGFSILIASASYAQYSLDFNGEGDYVALNGTDFAPPGVWK